MRKKKEFKSYFLADPIYNDVLVAKLVNRVLRKGKKNLARKIVYSALDKAKEKLDKDPLEILHKAIDNTKPMVEVRSRRVGGTNYQVPVEIQPKRQIALVLRWLVDIAKKRPERTMILRLSHEIIDAYKKTGKLVKKLEETHKMAEANRSSAYFRW